MRGFFVGIGFIMLFLAGAYMYIVTIINFGRWWDLIGLIVAICIVPVAAFFPLIYWIKEGVFPILYFIIWGIGIAGIILAATFSED